VSTSRFISFIEAYQIRGALLLALALPYVETDFIVMRNFPFLLVLFYVPKIVYSQVNANVIDKETRKGIPYVNIWLENENIGTTTDELGMFELPDCNDQKVVIFSAIGYETRKVNCDRITHHIQLKPKSIELQEIIVRPVNEDIKIVIGEYDKSKINHYFACGTTPWIVARYFEYDESFEQTPYLDKIKLLTNSDIKNPKFNIRLYDLGDNGEPGNYLTDQNIISSSKKGKKLTEIDISTLNIEFPKTGFFIAIEWLIIDFNKYEYQYTQHNSKKKLNGISYEPAFGTIPSNTSQNSWIYTKGKWSTVSKTQGSDKNYTNKYMLIALELTLSN